MKKILIFILCGIIALGITGCGKEEAEKDLQETQNKYGWVEKETVNNIIAKLNSKIMDDGFNTPVSDNYMVIENDLYWFALTDEVTLYFKPVDFSGKKENDILEMSAIYLEKDKNMSEAALTYIKFLIKANNENITDSEIETLLKEAQEKSSSKKSANNGKGISVGIIETKDHIEYQVIRLYK